MKRNRLPLSAPLLLVAMLVAASVLFGWLVACGYHGFLLPAGALVLFFAENKNLKAPSKSPLSARWLAKVQYKATSFLNSKTLSSITKRKTCQRLVAKTHTSYRKTDNQP